MLVIAILLRFIAFYFFWHLGRSQQIFDPKPENRNVSAGTIVVFQCVYIHNPHLIPIWLVNNTYYTGSLPGHAINATGLVVTADTSFNGTKYHCNIDIAILTVYGKKDVFSNIFDNFLGTNGVKSDNDLKDPPILLLFYKNESLYLQWDRNISNPLYLDHYRLKVFDSDGVIEPLYINISSDCNKLLLYGAITSQFESEAVIQLQVCQDGDCDYTENSGQPQNLIAINFSNPSKFITLFSYIFAHIYTVTDLRDIFPGQKIWQKLSCVNSAKEIISMSSKYSYAVNYTNEPPAFLNEELRLKNDSCLIYDVLNDHSIDSIDWIIIQERCAKWLYIPELNDNDDIIVNIFGVQNLYILNNEKNSMHYQSV